MRLVSRPSTGQNAYTQRCSQRTVEWRPTQIQNRAVHFNRRDFLTNEEGKLVPKTYFSDIEIIARTSRAGELPDTYIPVMDTEVPHTPARKLLNHLYTQFRERYNKHKNEMWFNKTEPLKGGGVWIAPSASVIGHVVLKDSSSVWYGAVVRADRGVIEVGVNSNIQDGAIVTTDDDGDMAGFDPKMIIGNYVTIGHGARLFNCKIGDGSLIGIGATVLEGAIVEPGAMVAAGAVVPPGRVVPAGQVWGGNPARKLRDLEYSEIKYMKEDSLRYVELAKSHGLLLTTTNMAYKEVEEMVKFVDERMSKDIDELEVAEHEIHGKYKELVQGSAHFL